MLAWMLAIAHFIVALALESTPLSGASPASRSGDPGWPLWPNAPQVALATLQNLAMSATEREAALAQLTANEAWSGQRMAALEWVLQRPQDPHANVLLSRAFEACRQQATTSCVARASVAAKLGSPLASVALDTLVVLEPSTALLVVRDHWRSDSLLLRLHALQVLAWLPQVGAQALEIQEIVVAALADSNAEVRRTALHTVGVRSRHFGPHGHALALLVSGRLDDVEPTVRLAAAAALGELNETATLPALIRCARSPGDLELGRACLESLVRMHDPAAELALQDIQTAPPFGLEASTLLAVLAGREQPSSKYLRMLAQPLFGSCADLPACTSAVEVLAEVGPDGLAILAQVQHRSALHHLLTAAPLGQTQGQAVPRDASTATSGKSSNAAWLVLHHAEEPTSVRQELLEVARQPLPAPTFADTWTCPMLRAWANDEALDREIRDLALVIALRCHALPKPESSVKREPTHHMLEAVVAGRNHPKRLLVHASSADPMMRRAVFNTALTLPASAQRSEVLWRAFDREADPTWRERWRSALAQPAPWAWQPWVVTWQGDPTLNEKCIGLVEKVAWCPSPFRHKKRPSATNHNLGRVGQVQP